MDVYVNLYEQVLHITYSMFKKLLQSAWNVLYAPTGFLTCKHGVNRLGDRGTPPVHDKLVPLRATGVGTDSGITLRADFCSGARIWEGALRNKAGILVHTADPYTGDAANGLGHLRCGVYSPNKLHILRLGPILVHAIHPGGRRSCLPRLSPDRSRTWTGVTASTLRGGHVQDTHTP